VKRGTIFDMGRNARKRAERREEHRQHGVAEESTEPASEKLTKCPRCGSTDLVTSRYMAGITSGVDIICGHCNWHGMLEPGIW
jgi:hypothetical protein